MSKTKRAKLLVMKRLCTQQNWQCLICGKDAIPAQLQGKITRELLKRPNISRKAARLQVRQSIASVEHIVPKSKGGKDGTYNLVMTHALCNYLRGNRVLKYKNRVFKMLPASKQQFIKRYLKEEKQRKYFTPK